MKKLIALLLALALTLAFSSCTSDQPSAPSQTDLAESYVAELRAIFDAAAADVISEATPSLPGETRTVYTYLDTDPATLEEVRLTYTETDFALALELPAAVYDAVSAAYGTPNYSTATDFTLPMAHELDYVPTKPCSWTYISGNTDYWLYLTVNFSPDATPATYSVELSLRPNISSEPTGTPSTAP